ncbi:MAG TPA: hypothetical protein VF765_36105 [Polyangiaceae bacterium]
MLSTKCILPALALSVLSAACVVKDKSSLASDTSGAEDVAGTESDTESLASSFVNSSGGGVSTMSLAPGESNLHLAGDTTTVGNPGFWFQPAGCEQTTVDKSGQSASFVFNGCTGPLGLVELTGTVNLSWQTASNQLTLNFTAQNFKINRATIDSWQATAVVTASGNDRTMTWNATLSGTTGRGRSFNRTNQKTLQWTAGVACLEVSGQSTGDILGAKLQTTFTTWKRCADSCPQSGSEIQVKNLGNGDSIDIKYLGGPDANLTINGKSEEIGLACGD